MILRIRVLEGEVALGAVAEAAVRTGSAAAVDLVPAAAPVPCRRGARLLLFGATADILRPRPDDVERRTLAAGSTGNPARPAAQFGLAGGAQGALMYLPAIEPEDVPEMAEVGRAMYPVNLPRATLVIARKDH